MKEKPRDSSALMRAIENPVLLKPSELPCQWDGYPFSGPCRNMGLLRVGPQGLYLCPSHFNQATRWGRP